MLSRNRTQFTLLWIVIVWNKIVIIYKISFFFQWNVLFPDKKKHYFELNPSSSWCHIQTIAVHFSKCTHHITKTCLYNFDPLKPHFYIVNLGFTGVFIIFLISAKNTDSGCSLEPPRWGGSNEYPQSIFSAELWKLSKFLIWFFFSVFGGELFCIFE